MIENVVAIEAIRDSVMNMRKLTSPQRELFHVTLSVCGVE
jgi:hypothetical protein